MFLRTEEPTYRRNAQNRNNMKQLKSTATYRNRLATNKNFVVLATQLYTHSHPFHANLGLSRLSRATDSAAVLRRVLTHAKRQGRTPGFLRLLPASFKSCGQESQGTPTSLTPPCHDDVGICWNMLEYVGICWNMGLKICYPKIHGLIGSSSFSKTNIFTYLEGIPWYTGIPHFQTHPYLGNTMIYHDHQ